MFQKLKNWQEMLPAGITRFDLFVYVLVLTGCFVLFQQNDLFHTDLSSYAYLNGHFSDFYDYNKVKFERNDYLPLIYAIFALWNLPIKALGYTSDVMSRGYLAISPVEFIWAKLLLVPFFFGTAVMVYKIATVMTDPGERQANAKLIAAVFATSPIALFAVFIFGQYDVMGLFFAVTGFYFYVRKDLKRFAWLFAVSISFKFFALIIFVPLMFLAEKRFGERIKLTLIGLSLTVAQMALYFHSDAFRKSVFLLTSGKVSPLFERGGGFPGRGLYLVTVYLALYLYTSLRVPKDDREFYRTAVVVPIALYAVLFTCINWHPQWMILVTPFFALSYLYIKNRPVAYLLDTLGMFCLMMYVAIAWPVQLDVTMLQNGLFGKYFQQLPLINVDLIPAFFLFHFKRPFMVYLYAPLIILLIERKVRTSAKPLVNDLWFFRARFVLGLFIFLIPSLFCAFAPKSTVLKINPEAYHHPHAKP